MTKPKFFWVLGHQITVSFLPHDPDADQLGEFDAEKKHVTIMDSPNWYATFLHERVHAILHFSGVGQLLDEKIEEAIVTAIAYGLHPDII